MGNHGGQTKPLNGPSQDDAVSPVAGRVGLAIVRDLARSIADGELRNSPLAPVVLAALQEEPGLELASSYDWPLTSKGIRSSDEHFTRVKQSAGYRDWQRGLGQTATPMIVVVARSLRRSADAQALIVQLCDAVAAKLRLRWIWPEDPDTLNDVKNAIYRKCLDATEIESDDVLEELGRLTVIGPQ